MTRQNDHLRAEELISAYLDKRLSTEEKVFFERHIASCVDCRAQLETTRSMVAALRAMPLVKAPRSFVLPRELAKQPKRSFLSLYPALRLATVIAAMAFAILFASDLLIVRTGGGATSQSLPAAAPAPLEVQAPTAARQAVPAAPEATMPESAADAATTAVSGYAANNGAGTPTEATIEPPAAAVPAPKAAVSQTAEITATEMLSVMSAPLETTATPAAVMMARVTTETTPASSTTAFDQQSGPGSQFSVQTNAVPTQPAIEPLRVIEIALLVLAVVLGLATLVVRRKQA